MRLCSPIALALAACAAFSPGIASAHASPSPATKRKAPVWPSIELDHLTTRERFVLRPDRAGHLGPARLRGLRRFLRCHHTGRVHPMADRLPQLLYAIGHHFEDRAISIVAGYRAPKVAREKGNPRSPHKLGHAVDFKIDGVALTELRDYVRQTFRGIGIGYYPNSGFLHLDVGRKGNAFWIDYSRPGERAQYSADPEGDLASGRADGGSAEPPQPPDGGNPTQDDDAEE